MSQNKYCILGNMPARAFQTNFYYHIYNRGVDKRKIFADSQDYRRFIKSLNELNCLSVVGSLWLSDHKRFRDNLETPSVSNPAVEVLAYCLLPNHFHLLVKNLDEGNLSVYLHKLTMGYTKYFNYRYDRVGSLFQGKFKSVEIKSEQTLEYISAYINGNSEIHGIEKSGSWPWCTPGNRIETPSVSKSVIKQSGRRKMNIKSYLLEY